MIFERVKFSNDRRTMVPVILSRTQTSKNVEASHAVNFSGQREHSVWFCVFDTHEKAVCAMEKVPLQMESIKFYNPRYCLAASGEIKKSVIIDGESTITFYSQNFQVAVNLTHQLRVRILEYQVIWTYFKENDSTDDAEVRQRPEIEIKLVGCQEFILKKDSPGRLGDISEICLIPLLEQDTNNIIGTQLMIRRDDQNQTKTYRLDKSHFQEF